MIKVDNDFSVFSENSPMTMVIVRKKSRKSCWDFKLEKSKKIQKA